MALSSRENLQVLSGENSHEDHSLFIGLVALVSECPFFVHASVATAALMLACCSCDSWLGRSAQIMNYNYYEEQKHFTFPELFLEFTLLGV